MKNIYIAFTAAIVLASCTKFVEIPPAPNMIVDTKLFSDSSGATSAVLGLYINLSQTPYDLQPHNGQITFYTGLASDEIYSTRTTPLDKLAYTNAFISTTNIVSLLWDNNYSLIYKANVCLEGLNASKTLSESVKNQLVGECLVIRSYLYFNLINIFGDVPFVTTSNFEQNAISPRTSSADIYTAILNDVISAQNKLQEKYPSSGRARINKSVATAFLARINLYLGRWADAEQAATKIIERPEYILDNDVNKVFIASSQEAIWQVYQTTPGFNTAEGFFFVPIANNLLPKAVISDDLLSIVESGDIRFQEGNWVKSNTVNGKKYYYPYKYKLGQDGSSVPKENYNLIRKAELFLIRAEARAQLNKINGSNSAISDINIIRKRAGLKDTSSNSLNEVLPIVMKERRTELFCETGHRWFDLKRTGGIDSVMTKISPMKGATWNSNKKLWPIPQNERLTNPFLSQNPGYN